MVPKWSPDPDTWLASNEGPCTVALVGRTLPVLTLTRPPGFRRALIDRAYEAASAYDRWPTVSWRVQGGSGAGFPYGGSRTAGPGSPTPTRACAAISSLHSSAMKVTRQIGSRSSNMRRTVVVVIMADQTRPAVRTNRSATTTWVRVAAFNV